MPSPTGSIVSRFSDFVLTPFKKEEKSSWGRTFYPLSVWYERCTKVSETTDGLHNIVQGVLAGLTMLSGGAILKKATVSLCQVDLFIERVKVPQYLAYFFNAEGFKKDLEKEKFANLASGVSFGFGGVVSCAEFASWLGLVDYARISAALGGLRLSYVSLLSFTIGYAGKAVQQFWDLKPGSQVDDYIHLLANATEVVSKVYLLYLAAYLTLVTGAVVAGGLSFIAAGFGATSVYFARVKSEEDKALRQGIQGHSHVQPHAKSQNPGYNRIAQFAAS